MMGLILIDTKSIIPAMAVFRPLRYIIEVCGYPLGAVTDEELLVLQRRAYHWRRTGKVLPNGPGHTRGEGNSRRYNETTLPLIAVLLQISSKHPSIEELDAISRAIQRSLTKDPRFARCWAAAVSGAIAWYKQPLKKVEENKEPSPQTGQKENKEPRNTFLTIAFPTIVRDEFVVRCGDAPIITEDDIDNYVLNVRFTFEGMLEAGAKLIVPPVPQMERGS
jgi:hypothetical protein